MPAIRHACYRDSRLQSALMATTLAVHRGTWRSVDRYIALTSAVADHLRDYGIPGRPDRGQAERHPRPRRARRRSATGSSSSAGSPRRRGSACCWTPGSGTPTARWARCASPATASCARWWRRRPRSAATWSYLGPLDPAGVRAAIDASAVIIAASTWHDVLPTVIIEALASGRPVLGTALGGIPYLIGADDPAGAAGWVVPPDPAAMAAALPVARAGAAALAAAARARYERIFHPDVVTSQLLDIYTSLTPLR